MPQFTSDPPSDNAPQSLRLVRTPATSAFIAVATCDSLQGCYTHFINNRTTPCELPNECDCCARNIGRRWHGYLTAVDVATLDHVIFEYTARAAEVFKRYLEALGAMRGCHFKAWRPNGAANGCVQIKCKPWDLQSFTLPEEPNVIQMLCHIWNVPYAPLEMPPLDRLTEATLTLPKNNGDGRNKP